MSWFGVIIYRWKFSIVSLMGLNVKHNYPHFTAGEIIEPFTLLIMHDERKLSFKRPRLELLG